MSMVMGLASPRHNSLPGMLMSATAFALITSVDTIFKLLAEHHPAYQIIFFNACFAVIPIFSWVKITGGLSQLRTARPLQHFARAVISLTSTFAAIYAYSRLPLTDFYAIVFAGPLIVTALSSLWLGEKVGRARWVAIFIGFIGILIVTSPLDAETHESSLTLGRVAAFISTSCYALSVVIIRRMRLGESSLTFAVYGYMPSLLIGGILVLWHGGPSLTAGDIACFAVSGTLAGIANICLITAYHRTPVSLVAPFQYTQIIWGAVASYFIWSHVPEARLIMGAVIVAACGLFVIYQEMYGFQTVSSKILTIKRQ